MASKTIIQGYEPENSASTQGSSNLYSRGASFAPQGTMVPGMSQPAAPAAAAAMPQTVNPAPAGGKPIVGFAYSVSRSKSGEYWPLHIGRNTIGRAADNDIVLAEGTVSEHHAEIVIQMLKNPEKVAALVRDIGSTVGTMLNGVNVFGNQMPECHNTDLLTIGDNYELYLILVDATELGLSPKPGFLATEQLPVATPQVAAPVQAPAPQAPVAQSAATDNPCCYIPQAPVYSAAPIESQDANNALYGKRPDQKGGTMIG